MDLYDYLKENADDVLFVDRTGTIIAVYLKGDTKVLFSFPSISLAQTKYRLMRRELEGIKVA